MVEWLKLLACALRSLFKSRAKLEAESLAFHQEGATDTQTRKQMSNVETEARGAAELIGTQYRLICGERG